MTPLSAEGKTSFQLFLLRVYLSRKRLVVIIKLQETIETSTSAPQHYHLIFVGNQVYYKKGVPKFTLLPYGTIVLLDAADGTPNITTDDGIVTAASSNTSPVFMIYTSSPKSTRWKVLSKTSGVAVVTMNPWSWDELKHTYLQTELVRSASRGFASIPTSEKLLGGLLHVTRRYSFFGPSPRVCFPGVSEPNYMKNQQTALNRMAINKFIENLQAQGSVKDDDEASHAVVVLLREGPDVNDLSSPNTICTVVSPMVGLKFTALVKQGSIMDRLRWTKLCLEQSKLRVTGGKIFEAHCHGLLGRNKKPTGATDALESLKLEYMPYVLPSLPGRGVRNVTYTLQDEKANLKTVTLQCRGEELYLNTTTIMENIYYIPQKENQAGFDGFMICNGVLYLFQMTIQNIKVISLNFIEDLYKSSKYASADIKDITKDASRWIVIFLQPENPTVDKLVVRRYAPKSNEEFIGDSGVEIPGHWDEMKIGLARLIIDKDQVKQAFDKVFPDADPSDIFLCGLSGSLISTPNPSPSHAQASGSSSDPVNASGSSAQPQYQGPRSPQSLAGSEFQVVTPVPKSPSPVPSSSTAPAAPQTVTKPRKPNRADQSVKRKAADLETPKDQAKRRATNPPTRGAQPDNSTGTSKKKKKRNPT